MKCKSALMDVEAKFCKPSATEPCTTNALYRMGRASAAFWSQVETRASQLSTNPGLSEATRTALQQTKDRTRLPNGGAPLITSGRVVFPPYMMNGVLENNDEETYIHELTHACSKIRRQLEIISTPNPEKFVATYRSIFPEDRDALCKSPATTEMYRSLYGKTTLASYGMSDKQRNDSFNCISRVAQTALSGNANRHACDRGCPNIMLEETFADLMVVSVDQPKAALTYACDIIRDSEHGFVSDALECIAQNSESARARIKDGLQCVL